MKIAIIGGTGDMGFGLALRWSGAGHDIVIGSRQTKKAGEAAEKACQLANVSNITGLENTAAMRGVDLAVLAVPASGHRATLDALKDGLRGIPLLDITIPMAFGPLRYAPPAEGSNAMEALALLGKEARVAAAFHTVSAILLTNLDWEVAEETLMVGNDKDLKQTVTELAASIGITAYDAGALHMAATVESLTPMLIGMNKRYGSKHIGIRLAGIGG